VKNGIGILNGETHENRTLENKSPAQNYGNLNKKAGTLGFFIAMP